MVLLITIVGSEMKARGKGLALKFSRRLNLKDEQWEVEDHSGQEEQCVLGSEWRRSWKADVAGAERGKAHYVAHRSV